VRLKKTAKPKPTTRIVTPARKSGMPDLQLPEMSGMSEGLSGGIDGFEIMPDLGETTLFGVPQSIGNDFVGTFYDFKRDRGGRKIPYSVDGYLGALKKFVQSGWKPSTLAHYYHSPNKLYATTCMVPPVFSLVAPEAFGEPDSTGGWCWAVHYKGQLVHKDAITFRFWGMGDDVLVVRVDGKIVLSACWPDWYGTDLSSVITPYWQSRSNNSRRYFYGHNKAEVGDWITLEPGVPLDMEYIIGEAPGGHFVAMLAVEVEGVEYEKGPQGNPILPIFKTAVPSLDLLETIHENLVPGEVCVTNGPVFCDYDSSGAVAPAEPDPPVPTAPDGNEMRTWVVGDGKTLEAKFVTVIGGKAVLKDSRGRQRKVPVDRLSGDDRLYVELAQPPKFNIDFSKQSSQRFFKESPILSGFLPKQIDHVFSTRLKQVSAGEYNHELKVEFFAIGEEIEGDNYILFDRQESHFTPTKENRRSHTFSGAPVPLRESVLFSERRGQKYGGYLVVVTDERGRIIDQGSSHKWLQDILGNLRTLPVGKHFDKAGNRVCPPRPDPIGIY